MQLNSFITVYCFIQGHHCFFLLVYFMVVNINLSSFSRSFGKDLRISSWLYQIVLLILVDGTPKNVRNGSAWIEAILDSIRFDVSQICYEWNGICYFA